MFLSQKHKRHFNLAIKGRAWKALDVCLAGLTGALNSFADNMLLLFFSRGCVSVEVRPNTMRPRAPCAADRQPREEGFRSAKAIALPSLLGGER